MLARQLDGPGGQLGGHAAGRWSELDLVDARVGVGGELTKDALWRTYQAHAFGCTPDGVGVTWRRGGEVIERVSIAVMPRPGTDPAQVAEAIDGPFTWLDVPLLDISGTMLRERSRAGGSIRFLVSDGVWRYVAEHDLYVAEGDVST